MEIRDSDSYGCVLDHRHLIKEGVHEYAALSGWELTGPGSLPPPASAALVQVPADGQPATAAGRWPPVPEGLPVAAVPPALPSPDNPATCLRAQQGGLL